MGTWIVRGFGTAIMHGGATAIFAVMGLSALERTQRAGLRAFLPGFALAVALHCGVQPPVPVAEAVHARR